jgi:hypothetical protein
MPVSLFDGKSMALENISGESMVPGRRFFPPLPVAKTRAENLTSNAMSDKNPKAKRKQQAQQEMLRKHKAEETQRHQQQLHEAHMSKHPHDMTD